MWTLTLLISLRLCLFHFHIYSLNLGVAKYSPETPDIFRQAVNFVKIDECTRYREGLWAHSLHVLVICHVAIRRSLIMLMLWVVGFLRSFNWFMILLLTTNQIKDCVLWSYSAEINPWAHFYCQWSPSGGSILRAVSEHDGCKCCCWYVVYCLCCPLLWPSLYLSPGVLPYYTEQSSYSDMLGQNPVGLQQ